MTRGTRSLRIFWRALTAALLLLNLFIGCTSSDRYLGDNIIGVGKHPLQDDNPPYASDDPDNPYNPNDPNNPNAGDPTHEIVGIATPEGEFRAVWVATVLNLDFPSRSGLPAAGMMREIDAIVSNSKNMGLNTIILQVRPTGDAFYESDIFPWSEWLSGTQGQGVHNSKSLSNLRNNQALYDEASFFDPLAYWLQVCHANDMKLHAWLNPYRIIHTNTNSSDPQTLSPNNPVFRNPELAVAWSSADRSGLFLDPGLPEARQLIVDGIAELMLKYDVDGIHFDDYFYPGADFNDGESFALYGNGMDLHDWRRENVNELIRNIQSVINEHNTVFNKNVRWGISPTAIWKNGSNDPLGVPSTKGQESYHAIYADTRRWVTEEWIDYICPQIYWYIGYDIANFEDIFNWWVSLCVDYDVDLYIGHAAYREQENNQPPHWQGEILRQLEMIAATDAVQGSVFYRYSSMLSPVGSAVGDFYAEKDNAPLREPVITSDTLSIGFPAEDITITGTPSSVPRHSIVGTSIPSLPLYLGGEEVTTRTPEGFFYVFASLEQGDNVFTFSQGESDDTIEITRIITLKAPSGSNGGDTPTPAPTITQVNTPRYATVIGDEAFVYATSSTSGGSEYMLSKGQQDRIVAQSSNDFLKLSCGVWIRASNVSVRSEPAVIDNIFEDGVYEAGDEHDIITWRTDMSTAVVASYDGQKLTVTFGMHSAAPAIILPDDLSETMIESINSGKSGAAAFIELFFKEDARYDGHFIEHEDGEVRLRLKKRKLITEFKVPLSGITIMLDPGHGGEALGALGPFGEMLPEKDLTLTNALLLAERLEELGANVLLTRSSDVDVSLDERVRMSRQAQPDLFLSLHINSVAETTNARSIRGFTVWYGRANSIPFASTTLDIMHCIIPETNRERIINQAGFAVCRPWWAPHVLYEAGFIMNIDDFAWLIDPVNQARMADATVDVILEYFS